MSRYYVAKEEYGGFWYVYDSDSESEVKAYDNEYEAKQDAKERNEKYVKSIERKFEISEMDARAIVDVWSIDHDIHRFDSWASYDRFCEVAKRLYQELFNS